MWMIRFIQYPRNSVENLNRALYIKLLKIQWWSGRKSIPFPCWGRDDGNFRKPHKMKSDLGLFRFLFFSFHCFIFLICLWFFRFYYYFYPKTSWTKNSSRLALCANSLQNFWDVERIESFTHRWCTFHNSLHWHKWESSMPG